MVDYTKATGEGGVLTIRDTGTWIHYYLQAGYSSSFRNGLTWSATGAGGTVNYPTGRPFLLLGSYNHTVSGNVTLSIGASGSAGIGGPTSFTVWIARATVPTGKPTILPMTDIGISSMKINFSWPGGDGGSAINWYLVRYGKTNPPESGAYSEFTTTSGSNLVSNLEVGTTYYTRVYAHNAVGYGPASNIASAQTLAPSRIKIGGVYKFGIVYIKIGGVYKMVIAFIKKSGVYQKSR